MDCPCRELTAALATAGSRLVMEAATLKGEEPVTASLMSLALMPASRAARLVRYACWSKEAALPERLGLKVTVHL